jgi:hypothetical protein
MEKRFANLDKLTAHSASFKFDGKMYELSAMSLGVFMEFMNAWREYNLALQKEDREDMSETIFNLIHSVCPEFTIETLKKMTLAQLSAVIMLIMETVQAKEPNEEEIKKKVFESLRNSKIFPKSTPSP